VEQKSAASILAFPEIVREAFLGIHCALREDSPILVPERAP
jgi:hypothetical protein